MARTCDARSALDAGGTKYRCELSEGHPDEHVNAGHSFAADGPLEEPPVTPYGDEHMPPRCAGCRVDEGEHACERIAAIGTLRDVACECPACEPALAEAEVRQRAKRWI